MVPRKLNTCPGDTKRKKHRRGSLWLSSDCRNRGTVKAFEEARSQGRTMTVEQVLAASRTTAIINPLPSPRYPDDLTEGEVQFLCLAAKGLTDEQIAEQLMIAPHDVNMYLP